MTKLVTTLFLLTMAPMLWLRNDVNDGTYQYGQTYTGFTEPFTKFGGAKVIFDETSPQNKD